MKKKSLKIFIGTIEIAGYYKYLNKGFQSLGIESNFYSYHDHINQYGGENKNPFLLALAKKFYSFAKNLENSIFVRAISMLIFVCISLPWIIYSILKYDVFIFGFGQSLIPGNYDLPILRLLNKTVISNLAHGSEARPAYLDGTYTLKKDEDNFIERQVILAKAQKKRVSFHEKYTSIIIGSPYVNSYFCTSKFVNWFAIGKPNFEFKNQTIFENSTNKKNLSSKIRIIHCPTNHELKGSSIIISSIEQLKKKGHEIDFKIFQGLPHNEILKEIQNCDLVIDQIYSDTPMSGFVAEAAWFGKPSIVAGYGLEKLKNFVPEEMWPPSKICHPDKITDVIEELILDRKELNNLANKAQLFVHDKYNSKEVAKRFLKLVNKDFPDEWWIDPIDISYIEGGGQSIEALKENIFNLIESFGIKSLHLSHRPDLESAFSKFSGFKKSD